MFIKNIFIKDEGGAAIIQAIVAIALTALVGGGVSQIVSISAGNRVLVNDRQRADAFLNYVTLAITNPAACIIIFDQEDFKVPQPGGALQSIKKLTIPNAKDSVIKPNDMNCESQICKYFGVKVNAIERDSTGNVYVRYLNNGNEVRYLAGNLPDCNQGAPAARLACTDLGGILEVDPFGNESCSILPTDVKPCKEGEGWFVSDINPSTDPQNPAPVVKCSNGLMACPDGQYLVGVEGFKATCLPIKALTSILTPTPTPSPSPTPTPPPLAASCDRNTAVGDIKAIVKARCLAFNAASAKKGGVQLLCNKPTLGDIIPKGAVGYIDGYESFGLPPLSLISLSLDPAFTRGSNCCVNAKQANVMQLNAAWTGLWCDGKAFVAMGGPGGVPLDQQCRCPIGTVGQFLNAMGTPVQNGSVWQVNFSVPRDGYCQQNTGNYLKCVFDPNDIFAPLLLNDVGTTRPW